MRDPGDEIGVFTKIWVSETMKTNQTAKLKQ